MSEVAITDGGQLVLSLPELAAEIRAEHRACEEAMADTLRHAMRAGELLRDAKAQVKHGEWLPWLADNFNGSKRIAQNYMTFAANAQRVAHLGSVREAIAELTTAREHEPEPSAVDEYTEEEANALWKAELAEARAVHAQGTEVAEPESAPGTPVIPGQTTVDDHIAPEPTPTPAPAPAPTKRPSPVLDPTATPEAVAAENERTHRYAATQLVVRSISPLRLHPATAEHAAETVALLDSSYLSPGDDVSAEAARHVASVLNLIADAIEGAAA